uniref:PHD-type domain-containing protein n=1 Tax=Kalanchoe fedtschenkoi TaxID=63787 RepID=A0A7N0VE87_KALFE
MKNVKIRARWYYWPEDTIQGRRFFHGLRELFLSDHSEDHYVECINGKCNVRALDEYQELDLVMDDDYFWRFQYIRNEGKLIPESVEVFCICETPLNPDLRMILCDGCQDWFHLYCINMSLEESTRISHYYCGTCRSANRHHHILV